MIVTRTYVGQKFAMDSREAPKPRRPLPTPQRPNTPVPGASSSVAPATFYQGPPLPTRPKSLGSNYTTYVSPEDPPPYSSSHGRSPTYREPELITEENDDNIPELVPSNGWSNDPATTWEDTDSWGPYPMDFTTTIKSIPDIVIDGRDGFEEINWWDGSLRERLQRPGPGILPPLLAEQLHDPEHPLFSVNVTSPDIRMAGQAAAPSTPGSTSALVNDPKSSPSSSSRAAWSSSARATSPTPSAPAPPPPTADDVRTAVPHPNAYYCPKENGWVILSWKSSSVAPPLAQSFQDSQHQPLPNQDRRKRTESCVVDGTHPFGQTNKTHHFHKYENAIDAHKLTPPFRKEEWEEIETIKQKRRTGTVITDDIDVTKMKVEEIDAMSGDELDAEAEGRVLDLYVCCQCSFYCVASSVIPGVIPRKSFDEFAKEKKNNPPPGKTGDQALVTAFETIVT
jgi:ubiquitin carboxyl-terminal hydrolase 25